MFSLTTEGTEFKEVNWVSQSPKSSMWYSWSVDASLLDPDPTLLL